MSRPEFMGVTVCVVFCSVPDRETARALADRVLTGKLAACVTMVPGVESHYVWEGKREVAEEVLLVIKTTADRYGELEQALVAGHPYACPEIVALEACGVWEGYAEWVRGMVKFD